MEPGTTLNKTQVAILTRFIRSQGMSYAEGRPGRVTNDDYKYHLKYLVHKGYLIKNNGKYCLTDQGKLFGFQIDPRGQKQEKFWVHVACYAERKNKRKREILLQRKLKHPYFGDVYGISGKIHLAETVEEAAARKFKEETGLMCQFKLLGLIRRVRRNVHGEVVQDAFFFVCYGTEPRGKLTTKNVFGENFWIDYEGAIYVHQENLTAGEKDVEVIDRLRQRNYQPFFFHEEVTLPKV